MAFGIHSRRSIDIPLQDLSPEQFIVLAADTAWKLGWGIYFINASGLTATTSETFFVPRDKVLLRISNGLAHVKSHPTGTRMPARSSEAKVEFPARDDKRKGATIEDFAASLEQARKSYSPEYLTAAYERLKPQMAPPDQDVSSQAKATGQATWQGILGYFIPRKDYFITPLIIDLNILVFLLMVLSGVNPVEPDGESLIAWGANYTLETQNGQWWRLLTSCFLHIGIFHLLFNMYAFTYIGMLLEPYLGRWKFTIAYLLTGVAASATSLHWHNVVISAGASGAIFGMTGLLLALLTTNLIHPDKRKPLLKSIAFFVGYNLMFGMLGTIDNAAHIGGLISGLLIGYILYPVLKKHPLHREGM